MPDKEYIIFCDESEVAGAYYSNFYGGVLVGSSHYDRITARLNAEKTRLNLFGEVKWSKVTALYLVKYQELIRAFFDEVHQGHVKVRIMFRQNVHEAIGLTQDQLQGTFFRLYYQFIKHAFGLMHCPQNPQPTKVRLYFDQFPETKEAASQFKGFIFALKDNSEIHKAGFTLAMEDIAEFRSHDHVLAQCLDIVLGAMAFRLNNKHLEIPHGHRRRGKRTVAKEKLYRTIYQEICRIKPRFNIGISTGTPGGPKDRWTAPYLHWRFTPSEWRYREEFTKPKNKTGPTQPT